ncbi:MAG: tetratricopeptide repeat protein [Acidobacteria bacterium]|nr:tetratricopeptide repeat protein [Acidobacteriota bacterium]
MASPSSATPPEPQPLGGNGASPASVPAALEKVLASTSFRKSAQLSRFLRYAVESTLRGEGDQLKEYRLGVDVMGRPPSYDPHKDPIVRLEARRLRAKLREYYDGEGRGDSVRIDIPKGGYAASFTANGHHEVAVPAVAEEVVPTKMPPLGEISPGWSTPRLNTLKLLAAAIASVVLILGAWVLMRTRARPSWAAHAVIRSTENPEARLPYLRGRYSWDKRTEEGFTQAIEYFNQTIAKDPNYALAYSGLADSYVLLAEYLVMPANAVLPKAREAAQRAVQLDDSLGPAHASLAAVKLDYEWDWQGAEKELRRAIELNSNYATAHQWLAELLAEEAHYDEALAEIKTAQELEPLSLIINAMAGRILLFAGQLDPAIEQLQKTLQIEPSFSIANYDLGKAYLRKGMLREAIAEFQKSTNLYKVSERDAALAFAYVQAGRQEEARRVLASYLRESKRSFVSWYGLAFLYAALGQKAEAFACLEHAYQQHDTRMRDVKVDPFFESLRPDPRFTSLLGRLGLQ